MKFLLDDSADARLEADLLSLGHGVRIVARDYQRGLPDEQVLQIAVHENRVLITNDLDFGELVVRRGLPHTDIILFRLSSERLDLKQRCLQHVLETYGERHSTISDRF